MQNFLKMYNLLTILLINFSLAISTTVIDTDQVVFYQDFGPSGVRGPYNVTLSAPLRPGSVVSVVTKSDARGSVNLISDDIYVIHIDARIAKNQLIINTSKYLNTVWRPNWVELVNPVVKNTKITTTLIYELGGFRIFINSQEVSFYTHRTEKEAKVINLQHDYVYQIMYMTTQEHRSTV